MKFSFRFPVEVCIFHICIILLLLLVYKPLKELNIMSSAPHCLHCTVLFIYLYKKTFGHLILFLCNFIISSYISMAYVLRFLLVLRAFMYIYVKCR
jgi:hypothetical protein